MKKKTELKNKIKTYSDREKADNSQGLGMDRRSEKGTQTTVQ